VNRKVLVAIIGALVVGSTVVNYYRYARNLQDAAPDALMGTLLAQPRPLPEFMLSDQIGTEFGRDRFEGQWTLVFFGYTSCPDICPTTMLTLQGVDRAMHEWDFEPPQVVLISVDPARDSAERLAEYVAYFGQDFLGLRGEDDQLHSLALQMGAMYQRGEVDEGGFYEVAHSASIFLVDPEAQVVATFSPPHQAEDIAGRMSLIRDRAGRD
jgi:protein SCO1/2